MQGASTVLRRCLQAWFSKRRWWRNKAIRLSPRFLPQPDLALLKYREDFYAAAHPGPEDVLLVVEVADESAAYDREVKDPLYARAGIAEVWLVVLPEKLVEVYRHPSPRGFRECVVYFPGDSLNLEAFGKVPVGELLGGCS